MPSCYLVGDMGKRRFPCSCIRSPSPQKRCELKFAGGGSVKRSVDRGIAIIAIHFEVWGGVRGDEASCMKMALAGGRGVVR